MDQPPQLRRPRRRRRLRWWQTAPRAAVTLLAFLLVWLVLVSPEDIRHPSAGTLLRIPAEGLAFAALLLALPARAKRAARMLTATAAVLLGIVVVLELADYGSYRVLDRPAHPMTDRHLLGAGLDYVHQGYGAAAAAGAGIGAVALVVVLFTLVAACVARIAGVLRRHRGRAVRPLAALVAVWVVLALLGVQVAGHPVAAHGVVVMGADQVDRARSDLADQGTFARQLAAAADTATPGSLAQGPLRGKDVVVVFVESYGRVAVEDPDIGPGVDAVLDAGTRDLEAAGFSARTGYLTSATFGGRSWLGHSTFLSGTWVDSQPRYQELLAGDHPTLVSDFEGAGWRTAAIMPGTGRAWPEGQKFYGYDTIHLSTTLGYRGPAFSWSPMPDQFVLSQAHRLLLGPRHSRPALTTVELTSSHNPWAPLPTAVPWSAVGDGSVFTPQPRRGRQPADVWKDPAQVRTEYGHAIEYSVSTVLSFIRQYATEDTVVIFLGDHQPVRAVTGEGAGHDVPVAIVAKDPAVLDRIASWGWTDGVHPRRDTPVWPMDAFREKFLSAFATPAG